MIQYQPNHTTQQTASSVSHLSCICVLYQQSPESHTTLIIAFAAYKSNIFTFPTALSVLSHQIRVIKQFGPLAVQTSIVKRRGNFVTSHGRLQISPFLMRKGWRSEITETKVVFFIQGDGSIFPPARYI